MHYFQLENNRFHNIWWLSLPIEAIHRMITGEKAPRNIVEQMVDLGKQLIIIETGTGKCIAHHNP